MPRYATPSQRRFVLAAKLRPEDPSSNWSLVSALPEGTDPHRYAAAVQSITVENGTYNEVFDIDDDGTVAAVPVKVDHHCDVTHYPDVEALRASVKAMGDTAFDLSRAPLYHAEVAVAGGCVYLVIVGSHIVGDGRAFYNAMQDFSGRYDDPDYVSPSSTSPADTVEETSDRLDDAIAYFARTFAGMDGLQIDEWDRRDAKGRIVGEIVRVPMPFDDYRGAKALAEQIGARRYSVLLTAFGLTLSCLTGDSDLAVSNPMANRRANADAAATRGVRVNALPARVNVGAHTTFAELCGDIDAQIAQMVEFEQFAFSDFARRIFTSGSVDSTQPSAAFTVHPQVLSPTVGGKSGEPVQIDRDYIQYPVAVSVEVNAETVNLIVEKSHNIPAVDIATLFRTILRQAVESDGRVELDALRWDTPETAGRIDPFNEWEPTTLVREFARAVHAHGDDIAVQDEHGTLTYRQLDARSDRIAAGIVSSVPDTTVGVAMDPSAELIATVLAVFKSAKTYMPLDPSMPAGRLEQIVRSCGGLTVLGGADEWSDVDGVRSVDVASLQAGAQVSLPTPEPETLAYTIFTSGTTGVPKGVQITHRSAARFFDSFDADLSLKARRWPLLHSISFDISIVETFNAVLSGAALYIPAPGIKRDPPRLRDYLEDNEIDVISQTPSAFAMLAPHLEDGRCPALKTVLFCGERLEMPSLIRFVEARPDIALINCYGITETTMHHTHYRVPSDPTALPEQSSIGVPLSDTGMRVVDKKHRTLPRGVAGELAVSGPGVMVGYLGAPAVTAAKVIDIDGDRTYLSGDRGYLDESGQFVVLGRFDSQVKVRGHRCELGEIASAVRKTGEIDKVHAAVFGSGLETELVCFVVLAASGTLDRLRSSLRQWLPRYLEPNHYVVLPELPVNANGKTDTVALAELFASRTVDEDVQTSGSAHDLSIGDTVVAIWRDVLGHDDFAGSTRFFEAGGTSAALLQVRQQIEQRLAIDDFDVVDLFEYCTPDLLTEFLEELA